MFKFIRSKKLELITYVMIAFIFVIIMFGGVNIYKSANIINNQANSNFLFVANDLRVRENNYFTEPEEEVNRLKNAIEVTLNFQKLQQIAPIASKYSEHKIPYIENYLEETVTPLLLYSAKNIDGITGIYFQFDDKTIPNKELIGRWYTSAGYKNILKLTDNGLAKTMYPENREDLDWFYVPKKARLGIWTKPYEDDDLKIPMVTYSAPVYAGGKFIGIVGVDISLDEIKKQILGYSPYDNGKAYLINRDNEIIFAKGYAPLDSTKLIDEKLYNFLANEYFTHEDDYKNADIHLVKSSKNLFAVTTLYNGFVLVLEVSRGELYEETDKLIIFTVYSLVLVILICLFIAIEAYSKIKKINLELMHKEKLISMGTMAAEVAHEINNPVGFVSCNIDTLKKFVSKIKTLFIFYESSFNNVIDGSSTAQVEKDAIENIKTELKSDYVINALDEIIDESKEGISRVAEIIKNLKDFTRNDRKNSKSYENVCKIIKDAIEIIHGKIKNEVVVVTELEEMPELLCNRSQIEQVLINMIDNAYYSLLEKVSSEKKIAIRAYKKGKYACIEIEDNGLGIEKSKINKIFDSFYTTRSQDGGTGLGLSISNEIITGYHNGQIMVDSWKNKGTIFIIKIPYHNK